MHRSGRTILLELEKHVYHSRFTGGFGGFYELIRETISNVMQSGSLELVFDVVCHDLRKFTGFSRVLVYRFDEEWNGTVVAESTDHKSQSLMHHRFPASDIPKQARELYTVNWLRLIPNVEYKPSPMVPVDNPLTGKPLDMSNAVLRSVSPVHLEYMKNMGQLASMSISLLKGQKLWGLIACHHPEPLYLRYDVRVASEFIGQMVSTQIVARDESVEADHRLQLKTIYEELLRSGGRVSNIVSTLQKNSPSLLALADSPGAAVFIDNHWTLIGSTPTEKQVQCIAEFVREQNQNLYSTSQLQKVYEPANKFLDKASGVLAVQFTHPDTAMIIWFRPEMTEQIPWAGNPNLSKSVSSDGRIHPRSSFATWMQSNSGIAKKWQDSHVSGVEQLRLALMSLSMQEGTTQESKLINETDQIELANAMTAGRKTTNVTDGESKLPASVHKQDDLEELVHSGLLLYRGFAEVSLLILNASGKVENWSGGAKSLLMIQDRQKADLNFSNFLSEDDVMGGRLERIFDDVKRRGRADEELWLYRPDRSSFWAHLIISRILNEESRLIGFSVVIRDITEDKSLEEELRATKLAADAANVAKTSFIANISHEIRTPLGAILGFSEIMSQKDQTDEDRDVLYSRIKRNGDQLIALINDLLDVTKIEAGRLEVEKIPFDLQSLLCDLRETFKIKAAEKSLLFRIVVKEELPRIIICDPTRIRQILVNLLSNAIKFTENGGSVSLLCSMDSVFEGTRLTFRVVDTGRGMSEVEMSKLFQPFVQADVSMTRQYGGTGLGLFVSQRLARALGGDLNIENSVPGEGTTFLVRIDVEKSKDNSVFSSLEDSQSRSPSLELKNLKLNFSSKRILVVDDAADNRTLVEHFLGETGAFIEYAVNGQDALQKIEAENFDLVLMDIQMPVMDGNRAMAVLKSKDYQKPVIALTANAMQGEREISLGLGF